MKAKPNPTPDEIRKLCHDVQRTWSRRERWKRSGKPNPRPWTIPLVNVGEIMAAVRDMEGAGQ
jgi:hypothetical protein